MLLITVVFTSTVSPLPPPYPAGWLHRKIQMQIFFEFVHLYVFTAKIERKLGKPKGTAEKLSLLPVSSKVPAVLYALKKKSIHLFFLLLIKEAALLSLLLFKKKCFSGSPVHFLKMYYIFYTTQKNCSKLICNPL